MYISDRKYPDVPASMEKARVTSGIESPIFILGTTRSGTTLLALMLGHHSKIAYAGELEWVWDSMQDSEEPPLADYHEWLSFNRSYLFHNLRIDPALGFRELTRDLLRQLRDSYSGVSARDKGEVACQVHRHYEQARVTYPSARFIHIVRDGRDVCASWIKFGWLGNGYEAGRRWKQAIDEWHAVKTLIPPVQCIELRFRDLISAPEIELRRLCAFLNLAFDPAMLKYHEDTSYEPVDRGQAGKWRTQLSPRDLRLFEGVAADALIRSGYELSGESAQPVTGLAWVAAAIEDKLKHHRARARKYGVKLWCTDLATHIPGLSKSRKQVQLAIHAIDNDRLRKHDGHLR